MQAILKLEVSDYKQFRVIEKGVVKLDKSDNCYRSVLHEILHSLGFVHSSNPQDVLFPAYTVSYEECDDDFNINEDIYKLINKLYAAPLPK